MAAKIFIDGEAGTTGLQIRERLAGRRDIEVLSIDPDKRKDQSERKRLLNAADVAILCLPDDAAKESVSLVDNDADQDHRRLERASRAPKAGPMALPRWTAAQADAIAGSKRVANPGCWPQGAIATLRPMIEAGLVPADFPVTVHGISGYTGGGRSMIADYEAAGEDANEFLPYGLTFKHKHLPELQAYAKLTASAAVHAGGRRFCAGHGDHRAAAALGAAEGADRARAACGDRRSFRGNPRRLRRNRAAGRGRAHARAQPRALQRHQPHAAPCLCQRRQGPGGR